MTWPRCRWRSDRGLTLIEVLISVALIGIVVVPITLLLSNGQRSVAVGRYHNEATHAAQAKIEQIRANPALVDRLVREKGEQAVRNGVTLTNADDPAIPAGYTLTLRVADPDTDPMLVDVRVSWDRPGLSTSSVQLAALVRR